MKCEDCFFFRPQGEFSGECHFNAPFTTERHYKDAEHGDARGIYIARNTEWTKVGRSDFCGQFKERVL